MIDDYEKAQKSAIFKRLDKLKYDYSCSLCKNDTVAIAVDKEDEPILIRGQIYLLVCTTCGLQYDMNKTIVEGDLNE